MISKGSERGMQKRSAEKECLGRAGITSFSSSPAPLCQAVLALAVLQAAPGCWGQVVCTA